MKEWTHPTMLHRVVLLGIACTVLTAPAMEKTRQGLWTTPPDLTDGGTRDVGRDWNLGPTGAHGWLWTGPAASRDARQILVTRIEEGSPADKGGLKVDDVIVGVDDKTFDRDVRKALAHAITEAETARNDGRLRLNLWREGRDASVTLNLDVLGSYSATSPFDCEKTEALVDGAVAYLKDNLPGGGIAGHIAALGLLATGRDDVLPVVKAYAHDISDPDEVLSLETVQSYTTWFWSYKCLFLTEYFLRTNDEYVLPVIREYATKIAMGQSGVGTWGHAMTPKDINDGELYGVLGGYGAMNQASLVSMMSLLLAQKCGVNNDAIEQAIRRGDTFFSHYINKGAIPYGDHAPRVDRYDDNGKTAAAAVMYSLMDKDKGAEGTVFFSAMTLAETPTGRESGHTGHFYNHLWGGLGPARAGANALTASYEELRWYYELERNWRGGFVYQGPPGIPAQGGANNKYINWDTTGSRLLQMCLPRQALHLTGRDLQVPDPLSRPAAARLLALGRLATHQDRLGELEQPAILQMLRDPLPPTRHMAARALAMQEINIVDELIRMLDSPDRNARYGACQALSMTGHHNAAAAVEALLDKAVNSDDVTMQLYAIDALVSPGETGLAAAARPAVPSLLKLAVRRSPDDPRRLVLGKLASALCYPGGAARFRGLLHLHGLEDVDRSLLIPAIQAMLTADDGHGRSMVASLYGKLNPADLEALWGDIYRATRDRAPSGVMFADGVRGRGVAFLQEHGFKEGVDIAARMLAEDRWGRHGREWQVLPVVKAYGGSAKPVIPVLEELIAQEEAQHARVMARRRGRGQSTTETSERAEKLRDIIRQIQEGEEQELRSIMPYVKE